MFESLKSIVRELPIVNLMFSKKERTPISKNQSSASEEKPHSNLELDEYVPHVPEKIKTEKTINRIVRNKGHITKIKENGILSKIMEGSSHNFNTLRKDLNLSDVTRLIDFDKGERGLRMDTVKSICKVLKIKTKDLINVPKSYTYNLTSHKLTYDMAEAIRKDTRKNNEIARCFGVSPANISLIKKNKIWKQKGKIV